MIRPEDEFAYHLDEALTDKRVVDRQRAGVEKIRQQLVVEAAQKYQQKQNAQWVEKLERIETERARRNRVVVELNSRLPIKKYLETLRKRTDPAEELKQWGPEEGKIAYSLTYNRQKNKKIHVANKKELKEKWVTHKMRHQGGGRTDSFEYDVRREESFIQTTPIYRRVNVSSVLFVILDERGSVSVGRKNLLEAPTTLESIRGLLGNSLDRIEGRTKKPSSGLYLTDQYVGYARSPDPTSWNQQPTIDNINDPEGMSQFIQALTDFYVGIKTGQIK